ncbi:MAG: cysteine--tRNA ligase [Bacteroidales bacterium]|nr:cysteine--tRNA ligase [Bacteroidales bacterium]
MDNNLLVYNSLSRTLQKFEPINAPYVGMYVCGPTVYGPAHLGHARPAITFDLVFRYLKYLGYKVRYVRNITDVGHLEHDADEGEDKIAKKATLENLEPMEVVQIYTEDYHKNMRLLNVLPPSIEPHASGHIIEQQLLAEKILENGYAYESNGSVYFDIQKFAQKFKYGKLSGRNVEDLLEKTRTLDGQDEKRNQCDFALWKKASPRHIMHWPSKWSEGFPGWHLECSAMSLKYLGEYFDIHGGGIDLQFPHHECEIAQTAAALGHDSVKYWLHNNMITINGKKMGKSLGNAMSLEQFFAGDHPLLEQPYSPMTVRFFILQAHYRSTLDFSNEALKASEKGLEKLMSAINALETIKSGNSSSFNVQELIDKSFEAINNDFNTPVMIAHLFDGVKHINLIKDGKETITEEDLAKLKKFYNDVCFDILGLMPENEAKSNNKSDNTKEIIGNLVDMVQQLRKNAKQEKNYALSDKLRDDLKNAGVTIKDTRDGYEWSI